MERWDLRAENAVTNQKKGAGAISALKRRRGEKLLGTGEHAFAGTQMKLMDGSRGRRERAPVLSGTEISTCVWFIQSPTVG